MYLIIKPGFLKLKYQKGIKWDLVELISLK